MTLIALMPIMKIFRDLNDKKKGKENWQTTVFSQPKFLAICWSVMVVQHFYIFVKLDSGEDLNLQTEFITKISPSITYINVRGLKNIDASHVIQPRI